MAQFDVRDLFPILHYLKSEIKSSSKMSIECMSFHENIKGCTYGEVVLSSIEPPPSTPTSLATDA